MNDFQEIKQNNTKDRKAYSYDEGFLKEVF